MVLEKTLESPLDCKEIQPVHPKGNQSWVFTGRTDAEAPILCPPDAKNWFIGKDPDAGKDWRQMEKGTRGWDVWIASLTQWTWVWVNSRRWWWTGRPGVLQFMGSQRVRHGWVTELNWIYLTDAFELSCWRRLLRVPWTARRSNYFILKEISLECSLEGLILKLKLQYFGRLMRRAKLIWKDPDAGKDWGQEEKGTTEDEMVGWHHWLNQHGFGWTAGVGDGQGGLACCSSWVRKESDTTEWLNWTEFI